MANKKLDFSALLNDERGKPFSGNEKQTLAATLSSFLGTETEGKTLKLYGWHKTLQVQTYLEIDDADIKELNDILENKDKRLFVFVKGQLLDVINNPVKK